MGIKNKTYSLAKDKIKILLLEGLHENAHNFFAEHGFTNVECHKKSLEKDELIEKIKDVHIIGIRSRTNLTEEVLSHARKLVAIGCYSIGTNQVDLESARQYGIPVFNAPFSNTRSVAELVISECIFLIRFFQRISLRNNPNQTIHSDVKMPSLWMNSLMYKLISLEIKLFKFSPWGSSIFVSLKK